MGIPVLAQAPQRVELLSSLGHPLRSGVINNQNSATGHLAVHQENPPAWRGKRLTQRLFLKSEAKVK